MSKELKEFLDKNHLWKLESNLANIKKPFTKDTPIYITGISGPQGKTTLKNLLLKVGYTNIKELEDTYNESVEEATRLLRARRKRYTESQFREVVEDCFAKRNAYYIEKYLKEGFVINFGEKTLKNYKTNDLGKEV